LFLQEFVSSEERMMNLEDKVREAIIAELQRQAEAGQQGLRVNAGEAEMITIEGRVNLDELAMAIVGSLAGGP
jgi:hypothetical protein